jgi:hypothetical protein
VAPPPPPPLPALLELLLFTGFDRLRRGWRGFALAHGRVALFAFCRYSLWGNAYYPQHKEVLLIVDLTAALIRSMCCRTRPNLNPVTGSSVDIEMDCCFFFFTEISFPANHFWSLSTLSASEPILQSVDEVKKVQFCFRLLFPILGLILFFFVFLPPQCRWRFTYTCSTCPSTWSLWTL